MTILPVFRSGLQSQSAVLGTSELFMMTVLLVIIRSAASKVKNGLVILKNGLISPKRLKLFENVGSKSALFDTKLTWGQT